MKRARRKKTITESKNEEESDEKEKENDPFTMLTLDSKAEILMKLKAKEIAKLTLVSTHLSSIIRGKDFTDLYMNRSSTRPRLLFSVYRNSVNFFHSCSQVNPVSEHRRVSIIPNPRSWCDFTPPIRGLICCLSDSKVLVGNPTTGQFIALPRVITRRVCIYTFFGYDPVNDEYKVLCMTVKNGYQRHRGSLVVSEEHQVFTVGGKEPWRLIECKLRHLPPFQTKGLCVNGVVYYYAWIGSEGSLISFDVRYEEFNVIKLPEDVRHVEEFSVVNYKGKIALTSQSVDGTFDLRILENVSKQEWSRVSVVVPTWKDLVGHKVFCFKGALSSGELIFATISSANPFYFICFDPKENKARKVVIEGLGNDSAHVTVFLDHVESHMVLSNLR